MLKTWHFAIDLKGHTSIGGKNNSARFVCVKTDAPFQDFTAHADRTNRVPGAGGHGSAVQVHVPGEPSVRANWDGCSSPPTPTPEQLRAPFGASSSRVTGEASRGAAPRTLQGQRWSRSDQSAAALALRG